MHGYFMDIRLYKKAKSVADPFEFEQYRKKKIKEKIEEERSNRVVLQVGLPLFHLSSLLCILCKLSASKHVQKNNWSPKLLYIFSEITEG